MNKVKLHGFPAVASLSLGFLRGAESWARSQTFVPIRTWLSGAWAKKIAMFFLFLFFVFFFKPSFSQGEILPLNEIKPGMKGYGKTVFKGAEIEIFPVTVLGIAKKFFADQDVILISIDGGYCVEHQSAVIAGMSGSPVYINGKLIGAIAYGWGFSKEPIAGVTPIEDMFKQLLDIKPHDAESHGSKVSKINPVKIGKLEIKRIKIGKLKKDEFTPDDTLVMEPLTGYFTISGLSERTRKWLNEKLDGIVYFESGSGGYLDYKGNMPIEPGASVGVVMLKGDIVASGTGTLTYKKGDILLAFGHEMLNSGKVDMPFTANFVHGINPSYRSSMKLASPVKDIGALELDKINGVKASLGKKAFMFPVQINIKDSSTGRSITYNMESVDHFYITPYLVAGALLEGISKFVPTFAERTATVRYSYSFGNYKDLSREDVFSSDELDFDIAIEFLRLTGAFMRNDFKKLNMKKIQIDIQVKPEKSTATVLKITADKYDVKPGDEVQLSIFLKPYNEDIKVKEIKFTVPDYLEKGTIKIAVGAGSYYKELNRKLRIEEEDIFNLEQYLKRKIDEGKNNFLIAKIVFPEDAIEIHGERYPCIPEFFAKLWGKVLGSGVYVVDQVNTMRISTPWALEGIQTLVLKITGEKEAVEEKKEEVEKEETQETLSYNYGYKVIHKKFLNMTTALDKPGSSDKEEKHSDKKAEDKKTEGKKTEQKKDDEKKKKETKYLPLAYQYIEDKFASGFLQGEFENVALDGSSRLTLSSNLEKIYKTDDQLVSGAYDFKNDVLFTASATGEIVKISSSQRKLFAQIPDRIINSMAVDDSGYIYAGTSPYGEIYKITPSGSASLFVKLEASHVWKLKFKDSKLWAVTGFGGKLYSISLDGKADLFFDTQQVHVRSFCFSKDGGIYLATGNNGFIYKVTSKGRGIPIFQEKGICIDGIAQNSSADLYFGWKNYLIRLTKNKELYIYELLGDKFATSIEDDGQGIILGTALSGKIFYFDGVDNLKLLHDLKQSSVIDIVKTKGQDFYVITCDDSIVYKTKTVYSKRGTFTSKVFDIENLSFWGRLYWLGSVTQGTGLSLEVRTGNTAKPDNSWNRWSDQIKSFEEVLNFPRTRFIQYRVNFSTASEALTPYFESVKIYYKYSDKLPFIEIIAPKGLSYFSKEAELEWATGDANLDELFFDIYYQKEGSSDWSSAVKGLPVYLKKKDIDKDKNPPNSTQLYKWDIKDVPDGAYRVKFLVYNGNLPKDNSLVNFQISNPFIICNKGPKIEIVKKEAKEGSLYIEAVAQSSLAPIGFIKYILGDEDYPAVIKDRILDSNKETFIINAQTGKEKSLEIEVYDLAGNKETKKISF